MTDKTTLILTFVASVLVPFIRDFVDLISGLKHSFTEQDLTDLQKEVHDAVKPVNANKPAVKHSISNNPYVRNDLEPGYFSRFIGGKK